MHKHAHVVCVRLFFIYNYAHLQHTHWVDVFGVQINEISMHQTHTHTHAQSKHSRGGGIKVLLCGGGLGHLERS